MGFLIKKKKYYTKYIVQIKEDATLKNIIDFLNGWEIECSNTNSKLLNNSGVEFKERQIEL